MSTSEIDHAAFCRLLMKCQAVDQHRHKKFRADIHEFVKQAIADSQHLVQGKYPPDIIAAKRRAKD